MKGLLVCANCDKGEECAGDLKSCTACKMVKYCNRECQIAHRPQHKKACKKRAAELYDEKLFKEPPPPEDCPICFLPLPFDTSQKMFKSCCGKTICHGCIWAMAIQDAAKRDKNKREKVGLCAFCRAPHASDEVGRLMKLAENGNAYAYYKVAGYYAEGTTGTPQNWAKANELYLTAGELGCADAYYNLGDSYDDGNGIEVDKKKAKHYWELAAMNGNVGARHNLGVIEGRAGNLHRATKHFILAARAGAKQSLEGVKIGYKDGAVTKDEYANTLREYQKSRDEMKSETRNSTPSGVLIR